MNGSSQCVCGSMPPGNTYLPPASTTAYSPSRPAGGRTPRPTDTILPCSITTLQSVIWSSSALTTTPCWIQSRDESMFFESKIILNTYFFILFFYLLFLFQFQLNIYL